MVVLGIESTCDETGIGIVANGRKLILNLVSSSANLQNNYGGVVPEVAAREQVKVIVPLLKEANNKYPFEKLDAIAVANGPGLIGSLLIGVESAKTLSLVFNLPLIAVNHLTGHIFGTFVDANKLPTYPFISLVVSGGHTDLLLVNGPDNIRFLGGTLDDAAGEAFDKVAKMLGLSYPGGPQIENAAEGFLSVRDVKFPRPMISSPDFNFSFSGLKTYVFDFLANVSENKKTAGLVAKEFQEAVCDVLVSKTIKAAKLYDVKTVIVCGGVAANRRLRERFYLEKVNNLFEIIFPKKEFSVDNGAMIAACGFYTRDTVDPLKLQANPSLHY